MSGFIGALGGGVLALAGSILGAWLANRALRDAAHAADEAQLAGFLDAVRAEIAVFWDSYGQKVREGLRAVPEDEGFDFHWPLRSDHFTVYSANAGLIGRVPDPELRTLIVSTYATAKEVLDSLAANSDMVREFVDVSAQYEISPSPALGGRKVHLASELARSANQLKAADEALGGLASALLQRLQPTRA
jgi:hypothetical protein